MSFKSVLHILPRLAVYLLTGSVIAVPAFAQTRTPPAPSRVDRSAPEPPPAEKYTVSIEELRRAGLTYGEGPAFPNKCYGTLSISDRFLAHYRAKGFSLQALCLAITSPWVHYNPETGKPLQVVITRPRPPGHGGYLLEVPDCFKNGTPNLDCRFNHEALWGTKRTERETRETHALALRVDAVARKLLASGRFGIVCTCEQIRWDEKAQVVQTRAAARCRIDAAPACIEQMSRRRVREGALVLEFHVFDTQSLYSLAQTSFRDFEFSPQLPRGYAYKIGSPEGDDDAGYRPLKPGSRIGVGAE